MKYKLYVLIVFVFNLACNKVKIEDNNIQEIKFQNDADIDTLVSELKILELESNDSSIFSSITQFLNYEDKFIIFDQSINKLFMFDDFGNFITNISSLGHSEVEYNRIESFCLLDSMIFISDCNIKTLVYNINNQNFIKTLPYFGSQIFKDTDSSFLTINYLNEESDTCYYLSRYSENGLLLSQSFPMTVNSGYIISPFARFYKINDTTFFNLPYSDKLCKSFGNKFLYHKKLIFNNYEIPPSEMIQELCDNNKIINFWKDDEKFVHCFVPFENDTFLLVYYFVNKSQRIGIYNKCTKFNCYFENKNFEEIFFPLVGLYQNYFVSNPNPIKLGEYLKQYDKKYLDINFDSEKQYLLLWKLK